MTAIKRARRIIWGAWVVLVVARCVYEREWLVLVWALAAMASIEFSRMLNRHADQLEARLWTVIGEREELQARLRRLEQKKEE